MTTMAVPPAMDTVKKLAQNMAWLMKRLAIAADHEVRQVPVEAEGKQCR
jgi:hypothetical protein